MSDGHQVVMHIDGQKLELPAEVPQEAEITDPWNFSKATVGKGMVQIPVLKILQSAANEEVKSLIEAPFWLEQVPVEEPTNDGTASTPSTPATDASSVRGDENRPAEAVLAVPAGFGGTLGSTATDDEN